MVVYGYKGQIVVGLFWLLPILKSRNLNNLLLNHGDSKSLTTNIHCSKFNATKHNAHTHITNNTSGQAGEHDHANLLKWAKRILENIICHVMEYSYYICFPRGNIFSDVEKYSLTSYGIFCHIVCMVCYGINNGILTLNMGLAKKVVESSMVWTFESKNKFKDAFYHPLCNQCSKKFRFFDNNYNIFRNVEMGGNYMLEKYLMKINFSKYINYLTNMCWNGQGIMILYINIHNSIMIKKLQSGDKTFGS